ncbi:hypothetical protein WMO40_02695 [Bacillaceae bacterium CLA-AA-H227]|uniref:Uncharacterized protein n=1 Tax=Robertmurraya yapensis (ex Hitch et al 2024) TaxID=3133160 RepID=A0ACC6S6C4_9BACI|nr:hypothetical protein [Bacillus yapensis]
MHPLLQGILGAVGAWLVFGLIFKDFGTDSLFPLIIGLIIGFNAGKRYERD